MLAFQWPVPKNANAFDNKPHLSSFVSLHKTLNMSLAGLIVIIECYFTLFYTYSCASEAMLPSYLHKSTKLSLPLPTQAWQSGNYTDPVPVNNTYVWPAA